MKKLLLIGMIAFSLSLFPWGCGGTDTGNPAVQETPEGDTPEDGSQTEVEAPPDEASVIPETGLLATESILDALCQKLTECFKDLDSAICTGGITVVDNIDQELGLEEKQYENYSAIIGAEKSGQIVPEKSAAEECLLNIEALSCDEPSVRAAYDPSDPDNFDFVAEMIPDSCEQVFEG